MVVSSHDSVLSSVIGVASIKGGGGEGVNKSNELHMDLQFSKEAGCIFVKRLIHTATFAVAKCSSRACASLIGTAPPDSV